jgi:phosphate transport system substrate-binding protein
MGEKTTHVRGTAVLQLCCLMAVLALPLFSAFGQQSTVLVGSGSSVPLPLYTKWKQEFNKRGHDVQMEYLPMGTTEGLKQIAKGVGDFGAGEIQLTPQEQAASKLTELPTTIIAIVPIYNLPGLHEELRFNGELLSEIFLGRVKTWDAPAIARLNPNVKLPSLPIKVFYRPAGKGTNYVFTEFLSKTSPAFKAQIGRSASPAWPVGAAAERSSDMADKVKRELGAIGYVEHQYAVQKQLTYGLVQNPSGKFVKATTASITAACQAVEAPQWDKFAASLTNAPGADSYPITSFTWLYLRTGLSDRKRAAALTELLNWMFSDGQQLGSQLGYSELPAPLLAKVRAKVASSR